MAPLGLVLIGMGACFIAESTVLKHSNPESLDWVLAGTVSLVVFNSGICVFGDAIISRVRYLHSKGEM